MGDERQTKRYCDYNTYLRGIFGERVQKISLDAGLGCPHRQDRTSGGGCIYCNARGSGTGAYMTHGLSIDEQIDRARPALARRYGARKYIAYFQSFTNTYAPLSQLKNIYGRAISHPDVVGLSVATRPDCAGEDVLKLLCSYQSTHLVWIELGLQSAHDSTLRLLNRGHDVSCFERSAVTAHRMGLPVCAHVILGLPGEDRTMMLHTARVLSRLPIRGLKIHLLYVVKGTRLEDYYREKTFQCLERDEYAELVVDFLELIPPNVIIQRLTGDPTSSELVSPAWAAEKTLNLKAIHDSLERRDTWQGRLYSESTAGKSD